MKALPVFDNRRQKQKVSAFFEFVAQLAANLIASLGLDGQVAAGTVLSTEPSEEEAQKVIDFSDRSHRAFAAAARGALLDADGRRKAVDKINIRASKLLHKLPGVSVHRVQKAALSFGKEKIEGQRAFARATDTGDDNEPIARNIQREVFQVVLTRAMNGYGDA